MKKAKKFIIRNLPLLIIFMLLIAPVFSFAQVKVDSDNKGLVPCGRDLNNDGTIKNPCEFGHAMILIDKVIKFILFALVVPIAAIMFFYAGFKLVTSGGNTEARGQAKNIFSNTIIGLVIAVGAWLIIKTILSILGYDGVWIGFPE